MYPLNNDTHIIFTHSISTPDILPQHKYVIPIYYHKYIIINMSSQICHHKYVITTMVSQLCYHKYVKTTMLS